MAADRYWKAATMSAEDRVKLVRVIWDEFATEFGGRVEVHERNFSGSYEGNRVETYFTGEATGDNDRMRAMVDQCMSEYDIDGWTDPAWPRWQPVDGARARA